MKSVIIYTYYQSPPSSYNLFFFTRKELKYREDIDYIIVINGENYDPCIQFPSISNLTVLKRENQGFDFGGHHHALQYLDKENRKYDYYFFMNSGVVGPILPGYLDAPSVAASVAASDAWHWTRLFIGKITDRVKLVGTTIVCLPSTDAGGLGPKVEGFFFMTDSVGLAIIREKGTVFYQHATKRHAIIDGEYGLSKCILESGYSIDCMLPQYQGIDWLDPANHNKNNYRHPSRKNSFYGKSICPYDVVFHKWYWHGEETVNFDMIQSYIEGFCV
jgi:hypothetical protein